MGKKTANWVLIFGLAISFSLIAVSCGDGGKAGGDNPGLESEESPDFDQTQSDQTSTVNTKLSKTGRPASPTTSTDAAFKFSCTAGRCAYKCWLDANPWQKCKSPKTYAALTPGDHTFKVKAGKNGVWDRTPAKYSWHIGDIWALTSATDAPAGRSNLTAVWTGTKAIFWGGDYYDGVEHYLNTGGVYDPATDSWVATPTDNAPSGRSLHSAVWADPEMIVWGGASPVGENTGGKYNPGTNSWVALETANAPTARYNHKAVWTGTEMIVWGGYGGGDLNTGGRYNGNSWTPTSTTNAPEARDSFTAVWTGSPLNLMIVWGGSGAVYFNNGGKYDPSGNAWTATSPTNAPGIRSQHTAVWTGSKMIIWGGSYNDGTWHYLDTGGIYDPVGNSWTATDTTTAPSGRNGLAAVWTGTEMVVWGGNNLDNTGGRYNPASNSWTSTSTTNAPTARAVPSAVWAGNQMIIWGGSDYSAIGGRYWP